MATNLISAEVSAEKNKFQEMRENLDQTFSELTSLVNQRKLDLDRKIDDLEIEYNNKNKQIEKDKQTMRELREMTEEKIDQNTLMDVQNNLIKDISDKIQKLDVESKSQLEFTLTLNWNFTKIKQEIDKIDLKLADRPGFENKFNPSISYQRPVGHSRHSWELVSASMVHTCTVSFPYNTHEFFGYSQMPTNRSLIVIRKCAKRFCFLTHISPYHVVCYAAICE